jgi:hypothetical protein
LVLPLQVLDHVHDAFGLTGRWAWHGLWANVQLVAYQLLLEAHSEDAVQHVLPKHLAKDVYTVYEAQGHLRHDIRMAPMSNIMQNRSLSKCNLQAAVMCHE